VAFCVFRGLEMEGDFFGLGSCNDGLGRVPFRQLNSLLAFSVGNSTKLVEKEPMRKIIEFSLAFAAFWIFAIVAWAH
jgi:hypothetical protein